MYDIVNEKIKFMAHYRGMFDYYFEDRKDLERVRRWWDANRSFFLANRRTTSVDLFDWDFQVLESLPTSDFLSNNSSKIRYLIKLGAMVHHLGLIHPEMLETANFLKKIEFSTDEPVKRLRKAQEKLFKDGQGR